MNGEYDPLDPYGVNQQQQQPPEPTRTLKTDHIPWNDAEMFEVRQFAKDWRRDHNITKGAAGDLDVAYANLRMQGLDHTAARQGAINMVGWQDETPAATATAPTATGQPQPVTTGTLGDLLQPFSQTMPQVPSYTLPNAPTFTAPTRRPIPTLTAPEAFRATSADDVMADPSYDFTRREGERSIINDQAAKGARRSGNSLASLVRYNQDYAGTRYGDIDNRRRADYNTNVGNMFHTWEDNLGATFGEGDREFSDAMAEFQPQFQSWQVAGAAGQRANELDWNHAFQGLQNDFDIYKWNKQFPYSVLSDQQRLGLTAAMA